MSERRGGRRAGRRLLAGLAALAMAAALSGCGDDGGDAGGAAGDDHTDDGHDQHDDGSDAAFSADEASATVEVTLRDYAFVGIPSTVAGPKVWFEAKVSGSNEHELVIRDGSGDEVVAVAPFRAGTTKTLAAELPPGTYTAVCLVREGARTHAKLGMQTTFTVE